MENDATNIETDAKEVCNRLINYKNTSNLSWTTVYNIVLKDMGMDNKIGDNVFLGEVIRIISYLGYDIIPVPFKLERYK